MPCIIPRMSGRIVKLVVGKAQKGVTLAEFLSSSLGISGRKAKTLLDGKNVFVNEGRVWMARHKLAAGDRIEALVVDPASRPSSAPFVIYRDSDYLVVDKKPGIVTCGNEGVEGLMHNVQGLQSVVAVHRLDRDTSGCLIMATSVPAMERLVPVFKRHEVVKEYHAIVRGAVRQSHFTIDSDIGGERSVTRVRLLSAGVVASHVCLTIETGRTHQIRRHMASIRHPVAGDRQYGLAEEPDQRFRQIGRQMLHASMVAFTHPVTGKSISVKSGIPRDFLNCLRMLGVK